MTADCLDITISLDNDPAVPADEQQMYINIVDVHSGAQSVESIDGAGRLVWSR